MEVVGETNSIVLDYLMILPTYLVFRFFLLILRDS